jgi:hypothetical protein
MLKDSHPLDSQIDLPPATARPATVLHDWAGALVAARWLWVSGSVFLITRLGIALVAYLGWVLFPAATDPAPYHLRPPDNILLDVFGSRWDTGFYVSIVEEGYIAEGMPLPSVAFFPLMPLLMRVALPLTGDAVTAGMLVANVALLFAIMLFYRLVDMQWGPKVADRAVWYLLIFPTAFFGSAIYSESVFLLCAIGALYFARKGKWWLAALFGVGATATRFVGLIVVPMLIMEWWQQRVSETSTYRPGYRALLAPLLAPLGTASFMLYLWRRFQDPLAFINASEAWGRVPQSVVETLTTLLTRPDQGWLTAILNGQVHVNDWFDFLIVLIFLALGFVLLYQHRWSEGIFVWMGALIPLSSGLLMSQRRYVWVLFPAFILLAQWGKHPWLDRLITTLFLVGLALFTALFANGYWVA